VAISLLGALERVSLAAEGAEPTQIGGVAVWVEVACAVEASGDFVSVVVVAIVQRAGLFVYYKWSNHASYWYSNAIE
jgi:hypothetical protein